MKTKTKKAVKDVPKKKLKEVDNLKDLIKTKRTILIASIKNIPASQFQEIGKKLRGKAIVKVPKKSLVFRAIDSSDGDKLKKLKEQIQDSIAILFSDLDGFDLAADLLRNKTPAKAKPGQIAPMDIEVEAGPTELVPGPAISELGALGIQIQIEKGKIHIKAPKVIAKEGAKISQGAADLMAKLDIKPFTIGFIPLATYDTKEKKLYTNIEIDAEKTLADLKIAYGKALVFAADIGIINDQTIKFMIGRAAAQERRLNRIMSGEPEEIIEAPAIEEKKEEPKEEKKESSAAGLGALFG